MLMVHTPMHTTDRGALDQKGLGSWRKYAICPCSASCSECMAEQSDVYLSLALLDRTDLIETARVGLQPSSEPDLAEARIKPTGLHLLLK